MGEGKVFCLPFELSFLLLGLLQAKYLLRSRLLGIRAWSLLEGYEERERMVWALKIIYVLKCYSGAFELSKVANQTFKRDNRALLTLFPSYTCI